MFLCITFREKMKLGDKSIIHPSKLLYTLPLGVWMDGWTFRQFMLGYKDRRDIRSCNILVPFYVFSPRQKG